MASKRPNPWDFSNTDQNLQSPNGDYKVEYAQLYEIAMGGPLGGACYLIFNDQKIKLEEACAGPIIWNNNSDKIALPIWTVNRRQKIALVDIGHKTITIYKKIFRVLHFQEFIGNDLLGVDSPAYMAKKFKFNIKQEDVENLTDLKL